MNAFSPNAEHYENWQKHCLLTANRQLEKQYKQSPCTCIALQISRNYRLLLAEYEHPSIKQHWRDQSEYWWNSYCLLQQSKPSSRHVFHFL